MNIILRNNNTLIFDEFQFRCCVGKKGITKKKLREIKRLQKVSFSYNQYFTGVTKIKSHHLK